MAPILTIVPALSAWAVIPFDKMLILADINVGLLYLLAMTSIGVYGIIIAGWASNSKYALLGALRSAAQTISYELGMGFALAGVLILSYYSVFAGIAFSYMFKIFPFGLDNPSKYSTYYFSSFSDSISDSFFHLSKILKIFLFFFCFGFSLIESSSFIGSNSIINSSLMELFSI